jgi:hypothetical protein
LINWLEIEYRMSNVELRMMKSNTSIFPFGVLHSLFDLPAMPARRIQIDPPCLITSQPFSREKHFAGQAGILRFTRLGRVRF